MRLSWLVWIQGSAFSLDLVIKYHSAWWETLSTGLCVCTFVKTRPPRYALLRNFVSIGHLRPIILWVNFPGRAADSELEKAAYNHVEAPPCWLRKVRDFQPGRSHQNIVGIYRCLTVEWSALTVISLSHYNFDLFRTVGPSWINIATVHLMEPTYCAQAYGSTHPSNTYITKLLQLCRGKAKNRFWIRVKTLGYYFHYDRGICRLDQLSKWIHGLIHNPVTNPVSYKEIRNSV